MSNPWKKRVVLLVVCVIVCSTFTLSASGCCSEETDTGAIEATIEELESEQSDLEARVDELEQMASHAESVDASQSKAIARLESIEPSGSVRVPNLVGMTYEEAKQVCEKTGWAVDRVDEECDEYSEGCVSAQQPAKGTSLGQGSTITLTVAKPDSVTVYVTTSGTRYHTSDCRYVGGSCIPMSLNEAIAQDYEPCSVCDPP